MKIDAPTKALSEGEPMGEMVVSIDFCGMQRMVTKTKSIPMPLAEGTRVADALEFVRYRYPDLRLDTAMIFIIVNEKAASLDRVLEANDTVSFLPAIAGG
jgi:molybdopterin converting factor small subunit